MSLIVLVVCLVYFFVLFADIYGCVDFEMNIKDINNGHRLS